MKRNPIIYLVYIFLFMLLFFYSCNKQDDIEQIYNFPHSGVLICNEGNFTYGNASLSFIDLETDSIYNDVFHKANGFPLGDVAQHITIYQDNVYISINNSGKIYVIDKTSFKYNGEITGLSSPRYICIKNSLKAYVTDLYSPYIVVFNPVTYQKEKTIYVGRSTEYAILQDNFLFVTSWAYQNVIYKINTDNDEIIDSLTVGYQPNSMVIDKDATLWILADGGNYGDENQTFATLTHVSIIDLEIIKTFVFNNISSSPSRLNINTTKDTLFFLDNNWEGTQTNINAGLYKMSVNENNLPTEAFINQDINNFYGFALLPEGEIFLTDALSFAKNGNILRYNSSGKQIKKYEAGIIPAWITYK